MSVSDIAAIVLRLAAISMAIYGLIAIGMILSQQPLKSLQGSTIDFFPQTGEPAPVPAPLRQYKARDGANLGFRHYPAQAADAPLLVFIHGSGWHGAAYDPLAMRLAASGRVEVALPDIRGHGPKPATRGDVAYVGQLEDDLADLISTLRKPGQKLVIAGHSSGGGLAIRYAGGQYGKSLDGAVLLAPFLKYNAPTMRPNSGGWARPLTRRLIGLSMLNAVGVTALNGLTAIQFNFPPEVLDSPHGGDATAAYSFRLNASYAPRADYHADIARLPPFLLIAGADDEAFVAPAYEPLMSAVSAHGQYQLIKGQSHLGVIGSEPVANAILTFLESALR